MAGYGGDMLTIKEYLRQARVLKIQIDGKLERMHQLRELSERATIATGSTNSGSSNISAIAACIVDFTCEIREDAEKLMSLQRNIQGMIDQIGRIEYRTLLELYYLNGYTWELVAEKMHYTDRHIRSMHGEALKQLRIKTVPVFSGS